jgi:glutathione S-transferase
VVARQQQATSRKLRPSIIAADRFTIADITALVAIDFGGRLAHIEIAPKLAHLTRWHAMASERASAKA